MAGQASREVAPPQDVEQFSRRIQAIAERWKGLNGGIYTIRAMALDMAHTLMDEHALSMSERDQEIQRLQDSVDRIAGSWKVIDQLRVINKNQAELLEGARAENERFYTSLRSIAQNTCCQGCQEAARVAQSALCDTGDNPQVSRNRRVGGGYE
ncbi:hypothetical protein [Microvirga mediterraneensis]|uniref:Uncharacterized protein n=1 Tax=Microvirga mediterraneensis TaxID=2754695 RepID=A0A838BRQ9_9HYPH|nr:hypothetical protein [Microvirga mediterraneensis]MBA1157739.1 hypothetical protein [Microvirga mediterraneensis]